METMRERWAREDAFIGPILPIALGSYWEERADRNVFTCCGRWYAKPIGHVCAQGPFKDILEARTAPLSMERP